MLELETSDPLVELMKDLGIAPEPEPSDSEPEPEPERLKVWPTPLRPKTVFTPSKVKQRSAKEADLGDPPKLVLSSPEFGSVWYSRPCPGAPVEFDTAGAKDIADACHKFVCDENQCCTNFYTQHSAHVRDPSLEDIHAWLQQHQLYNKELDLAPVEHILQTLLYEGKVKRELLHSGRVNILPLADQPRPDVDGVTMMRQTLDANAEVQKRVEAEILEQEEKDELARWWAVDPADREYDPQAEANVQEVLGLQALEALREGGQTMDALAHHAGTSTSDRAFKRSLNMLITQRRCLTLAKSEDGRDILCCLKEIGQ